MAAITAKPEPQNNFTIVDGDTCAGHVTSTVIDLSETTGRLSIHMIMENSGDDAVGTIYVKMSNKANTDNGVNVTFLDGSSSVTVATATDLNTIVDLEIYSKYVWLYYARTSGSCTSLDVIAQVHKLV